MIRLSIAYSWILNGLSTVAFATGGCPASVITPLNSERRIGSFLRIEQLPCRDTEVAIAESQTLQKFCRLDKKETISFVTIQSFALF
jgi:hypothetical protein